MKRHPYLQPLSDDHHQALVLARRMRRVGDRLGEADALATAWQELSGRFASELEPHFRIEERWLFPELEAEGERALCERALADHARLRALARGSPGPEAAQQFAELLEAHVRFEERELFPAAERFLEARASAQTLRIAEAVRKACADAAAEGYEDASLRGLCHEGAWEAALGAIRSTPLDALAARLASRRRSDGD